MEADFAEILTTLGEAQQIVLRALNTLGDGAQANLGELQRLLEYVSSMADQADTVMTMMLDGDAGTDLVEVAKALGRFFQNAETRITVIIEAHRR